MSADQIPLVALEEARFRLEDDWAIEPQSPLERDVWHFDDPCHAPKTFRGLCANEIPFRPSYGLNHPERLIEVLGLSGRKRKRADACAAIIANAIAAHAKGPDIWVHYSRDRNYYSKFHRGRRYVSPYYTYSYMMACLELLEKAGLIESWRTRPSPSARYRSRYRATTELIHYCRDSHVELAWRPCECLILRDEDGFPQPYPETTRARRQRRDILEHNAFLESYDIALAHPDVVIDEFGLLHIWGQSFDPRRTSYHRIFNGSWKQGGRWYGTFWQNLPEKLRQFLLINGEAVTELDYRACHLRLAHALSGVAPPFNFKTDDPYDVPGLDRRLFKKAVNAMFNASSESSALKAIAKEVRKRGLDTPFKRARTLMESARQKFPDLKHQWNSGVGLKLQYFDSEICRRVQRTFRKKKIAILSIHDSFIVPQSAADLLEQVMEVEMNRMCERLYLKTSRK